jgi:hypothetical protein
MRRALLYLALVFVWSDQGVAQTGVADWFPIHVGDKWIYEHETRDDDGGGTGHLAIRRWKTEETTVGSWTIPEGKLVGIQVRVTEGSPRTGYTVAPNLAYLIRGDCLYRLGANDWEPPTHQLSPDFLKWLGVGEFSADFCFPVPRQNSVRPPNQ